MRWVAYCPGSYLNATRSFVRYVIPPSSGRWMSCATTSATRRWGPETLAGLVHDLGPHARATTPAEAAKEGDVVVAIPLRNYPQVPTEELRGKIVIDTMNYYPQRDGNIAELDDESTTSSALLAAHLPDSRVVKGFNNIFFQHLAALPRATGADDRSALAIAGDEHEAKKVVSEHLDQIGYDTVDLGLLSEGWRTQPDTAAYGVMYAVNPQAWDQGARPASAVEVAPPPRPARCPGHHVGPQMSRPTATTRIGQP